MAPSASPRGDRLGEQAEERARRLSLATAIWAARGLSDQSGSVTVRSELRGLAVEMMAAGHATTAQALTAAADALSCMELAGDRPEPPHSGRRIAVFDDCEVTRDLVALALAGRGCLVTATGDLAGLLSRLHEFQPQLLLLDPGHPELQTHQGRNQLQQRLKRAVLPVVLFSDRPRDSLKPEAAMYEADAYLGKEHGLGALLAEVQHVLSQILW